jgi:hypothetical protein
MISEEPPSVVTPPPIPPPMAHEQETSYSRNLTNFKPIDSMDSMAAILNPSASVHNQPKFSNLNELSEDEQPKSIQNQSHRNQPLHTSSIAIKIETHSPVKIKPADDLVVTNQHQSTQITHIRSPIDSSPKPAYRFNGNL